jgi:hypothetical protein
MRVSTEEAKCVVAATRDVDVGRRWPCSTLVRTPLDLILALMRVDVANTIVILAGEFARDRAIALYFEEAYPELTVVVDAERHERAFVPACA